MAERLLVKRFDFVLIDSRTGLTDIGGICTRVMPEKLLVVFAPNRQNIEGVVKVARRSVDYSAEPRAIGGGTRRVGPPLRVPH